MRPNPHHRREAAAAAALHALSRRGFLKVGLGFSAALACTALLPALAGMPLRWALTGMRRDWSAATPAQVQAFLARWRASRLATLNAGAVVLVKLASVGYYVLPAAWAGSGYPGPNAAVYQALHA
ncbi:exported protein of unknown function [Cupriavidus taiwanensis]|uniref:Uncharacterized protein n=1 Tax=Cupriavidus taiwanensis TaxID=164546 RepID=A0A375IJ48_9BURK|nr:hypothetical protein [Cupriavidus taiwanensis]SPK74031.1 exported protein of unknown function [Cupriavidus taiwanensis]